MEQFPVGKSVELILQFRRMRIHYVNVPRNDLDVQQLLKVAA